MDQRLDPAIRWVWLVGGLAGAILPLVATVIFAVGGWLPAWVTGVAAAITLLVATQGIVLAFLRYRRWSYRLADDKLVIHHGVVTTLERWVPRSRVQYVDIVGGPLERALGLRTLVVYTAGSGLLSVSVPGLPARQAESLRSELLGPTSSTAATTTAAQEPGDAE